ncbi:hypothetical protein OBBRIDRAFT_878691 [Obba rivulosa]|uniref:C2H2-type domain-containing protein n=1 Tax=Obba rivulosa TaxID=1052685 RepID=A0A8E2DJA5_9APHY|nr:hypothetical protein OBBRIDRAFT_878691 [Obba rivulosa]
MRSQRSHQFQPRNIACTIPGCSELFKRAVGLTQYLNFAHKGIQWSRSKLLASDATLHAASPEPEFDTPDLDSQKPSIAPEEPKGARAPCDASGHSLPPNTPPSPPTSAPSKMFIPFNNRADFELANFLFKKTQISGSSIDELMEIWNATLPHGSDPPFTNHDHLYSTIDSIPFSDVPWQAFSVSYTGPRPNTGSCPTWMEDEYEHVVDEKNRRVYKDFMSGNWAWKQAITQGSVFCPVILGSDKTMVSIATGQNEYYLLYLSNGLVSNNFQKFRRQLFHASLNQVLDSLRVGMETPEVVRFGDGHYHRVVYGLGLYIADYPEQVWCPRCTADAGNLDGNLSTRCSHEHTLALFEAFDSKKLWDEYNLLHQVIKGTFIDHLVSWVEQYLEKTHGKAGAAVILADIDRRIAAVPSFPGLQRFPQGCGFKQWTGNDSKALMKVWLPAIVGHMPPQMVRAVGAFLDFCYLVRRSVITEETLQATDDALAHFHADRNIFMETGVQPDGFSLPRQHTLSHYRHLIQEFGAPNGLCSSIMESKHIKAVKEPWRRSSHYEALGQMLLTNQRLDKLVAANVHFEAQGLLCGPLQKDEDNESDDEGVVDGPMIHAEVTRGYPSRLHELAKFIEVLQLPSLLRRFLYNQQNHDSDALLTSDEIPLNMCPEAPEHVVIYPSAVAVYYAPSDHSGVGGMHREQIRAVHSWKGRTPRRDCAFVVGDPDPNGFRGLHVVCVLYFMSFKWQGTEYPCALVTWFSPVSKEPCKQTGMWAVTPDVDKTGKREMLVVHLDCMLRSAHLIGIASEDLLPRQIKHYNALDLFQAFYVNKYADRHAHEIAF